MEESHERVEWNQFFEEFEEGDHVVVYHGSNASDPFEVTGHQDIAMDLDDEDVEERLIEGETVTSTVTETAVVESVVTEEITVESELVDSEIVDQQVLDAELIERKSTNCDLVEEGGTDSREWFDTDRYLDAVGGTTSSAPGEGPTTFDVDSVPYHAELDVEETWAVTRELTERFVVESHITGTEITEADSLEDYDLDVEGLHRTIVESGIIEEDLSTEEFLTESDIETEMTEDDRVTTSFARQRTVEDEIVDRKHVNAEITGGEVLDVELRRTDAVVSGRRGSRTDTDTTTATGTDAAGTATLDDDVIGKPVVDATGDEIGTVTDVDEGANAMFVDPEPGLTERIKAALGWGGADDDDLRLRGSHVESVTDDEVRLKRSEHFDEDDRSR